uniref:NADH-ubiquinone oxidoreductase chain 3 n=1 Tax=Anaphothrips obscurus TaxID=864839 RepID=A0A343EQD9_9NEOP|nr:NADH dehydrogenase subunit 3 [Anaphothrips obscurus]ASJ63894.1 NADH dehydrogenase subunit 3 [Anaphothrips obscurus]
MMSLLYFIFFLLLISFSLMLICFLISKKSKNWREKFIPFECGFDFISFPRSPFSMRFFLIAIIFIIFDVEIAFILPLVYSIFLSNIFKWTFCSFSFFFILIWGMLAEWKEQSFDWKF